MEFKEFIEDYYQQYIRVLNSFDKASLSQYSMYSSMSETTMEHSGLQVMAAVQRLAITRFVTLPKALIRMVSRPLSQFH